MPGAMAPPHQAPSAVMTSKVVAVPKVDDDGRAAVEGEDGRRVGDAVGACLPRLVDVNAQAAVGLVRHHQRLQRQLTQGQLAEGRRQRRHHAADDDAIDEAVVHADAQ